MLILSSHEGCPKCTFLSGECESCECCESPGGTRRCGCVGPCEAFESKEVGSQEELLQELNREGFELTQATLSRDLKQLKVAKAASMNGKYVYVLPNNIMYKRSTDQSAGEMLRNNGFISLQFSGNIAVIRTRPGYASSMAYDIDNRECPAVLGTIAGDDTIMMVLHEAASHEEIRVFLSQIIPNIK